MIAYLSKSGSWNQPIADRQFRRRTQQKELKVVKKMCVSKDIWMCLLSAAIGGIISFLLLKFWNSPRTEATMRPKIPVEHDERAIGHDAYFIFR